MVCSKCGTDVTKGEFCPNCGTKIVYIPAMIDPGKPKGKTALILGIVAICLSFLCLCGLGSIAGIICGFISITKSITAIKLSKDANCTNALAIVAIILSSIAILLGFSGIAISIVISVFVAIYGISAIAALIVGALTFFLDFFVLFAPYMFL